MQTWLKLQKIITVTAANLLSILYKWMDYINQWTPNKRPAYISNLTRTQASTIFKARTRMLDVKTISEANTNQQNADCAKQKQKHRNTYQKNAQ